MFSAEEEIKLRVECMVEIFKVLGNGNFRGNSDIIEREAIKYANEMVDSSIKESSMRKSKGLGGGNNGFIL